MITLSLSGNKATTYRHIKPIIIILISDAASSPPKLQRNKTIWQALLSTHISISSLFLLFYLAILHLLRISNLDAEHVTKNTINNISNLFEYGKYCIEISELTLLLVLTLSMERAFKISILD